MGHQRFANGFIRQAGIESAPVAANGVALRLKSQDCMDGQMQPTAAAGEMLYAPPHMC